MKLNISPSPLHRTPPIEKEKKDRIGKKNEEERTMTIVL